VALPSSRADGCAKIPSWMSGSSRVVGGKDAPKQIPWQISFRYGTKEGFAHNCGGTLLNANTILSAAHCFYSSDGVVMKGDKLKTTYAVAGSLKKDDEVFDYKPAGYKDNTQVSAIDKLIWNTQYKYDQYGEGSVYDIVIVKLKTPFKFNEFVQPACLPDASFVEKAGTAYASGWGLTKTDGSQPNNLKWAALPLYAKGQCGEASKPIEAGFQPAYEAKKHAKAFICAGGKENQGVCNADSGGPLVVPRSASDNTAVVIGAVSNGTHHTKCGAKGFPTLFSRVTLYLDWIKANMK